MNFSLTPAQKQLQATIHEFCKQNLNDGVVERDKNQQFAKELWRKCGALQLQGLAVSKEYGGRGLDPLSTMLAIEALGYACRDNGLSFAIAAHLFSCVIPLEVFGSENQKSRLLPKSCNGEYIAANAITEAQGGSDAFYLNTTAEQEENTYKINGEKVYCTNLPVADWLWVLAKTKEGGNALEGITAFILERNVHDFSCDYIYDKMGMRTALMGKIAFQDILVDKEAILGKEGQGSVVFNYAMNWERIGMAALHLGTMRRLLEEFIVFARQRSVGRKTMKSFQAVQHTIAQISTEVEAASLLVYKAAILLEKPNRVHQYAAMAKYKVAELYKNGTAKLLHLYGAQGYVDNHEIERMTRDAAASTIYSGTSEVLLNIIAKWQRL